MAVVECQKRFLIFCVCICVQAYSPFIPAHCEISILKDIALLMEESEHYNTVTFFRMCYYTSESSMRRADFMRMINKSFPKAGLTCSFLDHQLSELIQIKRRAVSSMPTKQAVSTVGPQNASGSMWVLGPEVHIDKDGKQVSSEDSQYIWIGHMYTGPGVAEDGSACNIHLPLNTNTLSELLTNLRTTMKHNFFPALFLISSFALSLHYSTIVEKYKFCPVPIGFGKPGTGKTTALKCGLSMLGVLENRFWSCATKELYLCLCSTDHLPLGLDDPKTQGIISDLCMSLYNGAFHGTLQRGKCKPSCMAVIASNFTVLNQEK